MQIIRGGVLEDVFQDTFWCPWPWPRSLKSSKIALFSARGQQLKFCRSPEKNFWRPFFWRSPEKNFEDLFLENACACVLGPWLREGLSLALASDFFVFLALASSFVSSTPFLQIIWLLPTFLGLIQPAGFFKTLHWAYSNRSTVSNVGNSLKICNTFVKPSELEKCLLVYVLSYSLEIVFHFLFIRNVKSENTLQN